MVVPRLKTESICSEIQLQAHAKWLAGLIQPQDRILLEGPLGVGKSTFAKYLLQGLQIEPPYQGSPTFAIAHEYLGLYGKILHLDLYRLQSEEELQTRGVLAYYWEDSAVVISEWLSLWPTLAQSVMQYQSTWQVTLQYLDADQRMLQIFHSQPSKG